MTLHIDMLVSAFDLITLWQWENLKFDPPTTRKWPNRSPSNFARVTTSGSPTIMQNFITMRSGVFDPRIREILFFITDRKAGIKITFVGLFWFLLCTDHRQLWQGAGGRRHLTQCQRRKFSGVIWGISAQKNLEKMLNHLENAIKSLFSPRVDKSLGQKLWNLQC